MDTRTHDDLEQLLRVVLSALLDSPDDATVTSVATEATVIFQVTPKPGRFGQVCGEGGKNVEAVRTLMIALAKKRRVTVNVELVDPDPFRRKRR